MNKKYKKRNLVLAGAMILSMLGLTTGCGTDTKKDDTTKEVKSAVLNGKTWLIPDNADKPIRKNEKENKNYLFFSFLKKL